MTMARSKIVDPNITLWYHCISRCVRGAFLLQSSLDRGKQWIEDRLRLLVRIFCIDVGGYGILDSHLHLLLRLNVKLAKAWSKEEVLTRWAQLYPPRGPDRQPVKSLKQWIEEKMSDHKFVNNARRRLADLGWFMKSLKEPLARLANAEDGCKGAFWAARYKSIAILDEQALLATAAYIDLNPLAAGVVKLPEEARFTSLWARLEGCREQDRLHQLEHLKDSTVIDPLISRQLEEGIWLCPIDDQHGSSDTRAGFLDGFSLVHYLRLIDATSRLFREGKARVDKAAKPLLERLGTTLQTWSETLKQMFASEPFGVAFAFSRKRLREFAARRKCRHMVNLNGCPAETT